MFFKPLKYAAMIATAMLVLPPCAFAGKPTTHSAQEWRALAEKGDPTARQEQCMIFSFVRPQPLFFQHAVDWCKKEAEQGDVHMQRLMSQIYAQGGGGVEKDISESYFWLAISFPNAETMQAAQKAITRFLTPEQVEKANKRVADWKKNFCVDKSHSPALLKVHCDTTPTLSKDAPAIERARAAYKGRDYKEAFALSLPLAEAGNAEAQYMVGHVYHGGMAGELDWTKAGAWYRKSAEQGYAPAQLYLGQMLDNGIETRGPSKGKGVPKDTKEALVWYHKAAEQKYVDAYTKLSLAFYNGRDVPKNMVEAFAWQYLSMQAHLKDGSQAGAEMDRMFLSNITAKMTLQQQPQAKKRAEELVQTYLR